MRTAIAWLLLLAVCSPALAAEPAKTPSAADLYPLAVGNKWTFVISQQDGTTNNISYIIRKTETIDGVELYRLETQVDGTSVMATEHLRATPDGVFRYRFNGAEVTPPLKLISNPLKIGEEWSAAFSASGEKVKGTCKLGKPVNIKVPAGEFEAYELTVEVETANGAKVESNYWLAPKVGIVMQDMLINGDEVFTIELDRFEPGKKKDEKIDKKVGEEKSANEKKP